MMLAVLLAAALAQPIPTLAEPELSSRYTSINLCKDVERAPPGQDWVYYRCKGFGGIPVWYICMDSARCRYGFGAKPNTSGLFGTGTRRLAPIEWRGSVQGGRFRPFATIIRVTSADPDETKSYLVVYRLRSNGTSCIVGEADTNAAARRIADRAARGYRCLGEPDLELP